MNPLKESIGLLSPLGWLYPNLIEHVWKSNGYYRQLSFNDYHLALMRAVRDD